MPEECPNIQSLLRVYCREADRIHGSLFYEAVLVEARKLGIAGATVLRGIAGYDNSHRPASARLVESSWDLPVVIEMVDHRETLERILPFLEEHLVQGLVTIEKVGVLLCRPAADV